MVLTETKVANHAYFRNRLGYDVFCLPFITTKTVRAQGGVGLVLWYQLKGWRFKSTRFHRLNLVSCEVIAGGKRTPLIGMYLPPSTLDHLLDLEETLKQFRYQYLIVLGDLNANIIQSHNLRSHQVADLLMEFGLMNLLHRFPKLCRFRHMKTWL